MGFFSKLFGGDDVVKVSTGPAAATSAPPAEPQAQRAPGKALMQDARKAATLAQAIVADVALYNAELVKQVKASGKLDALAAQLEEGRRLFRTRVDPKFAQLYEAAIEAKLGVK